MPFVVVPDGELIGTEAAVMAAAAAALTAVATELLTLFVLRTLLTSDVLLSPPVFVPSGPRLRQFVHRHFLPQKTLAPKHSQYFLRQALFLQ